MFSWRAKKTLLRASRIETSWGVVTITAPLTSGMSWQALNGSSPVPGGESTIRKSSSPQLISSRNCRMADIFRGPRQTIGVSGFGAAKEMLAALRLGSTRTGSMPFSEPMNPSPSTPSIFAMLGPCRSMSTRPTSRPVRASV